MRIYLAELYHVHHASMDPDQYPYTVPLGIGFLAATLSHRMPDCEVRLFRDPNRLLKAVRAEPPQVMGFSFSSWNTDLSRRVSEIVRSSCPGTVIVGGGPSVDDADDQLIDFFKMFCAIDYLVPNEGESGLLALLQSIEHKQERQGPIPGVAYLDESGHLVRGGYDRPIVPGAARDLKRISKQERPASALDIEIPSPYLDGTLDSFLDEGLLPIIQTMRGCPYLCHFCVSGTTEWNTVRGFDLERVKAEIDYALSRSSSKDLILTDENLGLMGERDVEIARYIMERRRTQGSPSRLYYYTAKIVTPASRAIVELVAPIAWIGEFFMSFQTLNPQARQAIKRTNIGMDKLADNVLWARERKILTSSEMIYGFPYETPQTFFDGIEQLIQIGMDVVHINTLLLFPGIDLAAKDVRENFALQTRFRLSDCTYGIYDDGKLLSVDSEEVVVGSRWSTEEDYFAVRRYGFFHMATVGRHYLNEFSRLCSEVGIPMAPITRHLTFTDYARYPSLGTIMVDYRQEAESELKSSREEIYQEVREQVRLRKDIRGVKLNLVYLGIILSSPSATRELLEVILDYFQGVLEHHPEREVVVAYLKEILPNRIVLLNPDSDDPIRFSTRFDYSKWISRSYQCVSELLLPQPIEFEATMCDELRENLATFNATRRTDLQGIFDKTPRKSLLRTVATLPQSTSTVEPIGSKLLYQPQS